MLELDNITHRVKSTVGAPALPILAYSIRVQYCKTLSKNVGIDLNTADTHGFPRDVIITWVELRS